MKNRKQNEMGITLVALVITVIVTLILAGVGISLITGENGLFTKANHAASEYNSKSQSEATKFNELMNYLNGNYGNVGETPVHIDDFEFTATAKATTITVSTTGVAGLTYKFQINNGEWVSPSTETLASYTFEGLTPSTEYSVDVKAIAGTTEKGASNADKTVTTTAVTTLADVNTVAEAMTYNAPAANTIQTLKTTDNKQVKVPAGFTVLTGDRASATSTTGGVVIKDSAGNEFVWIPVDNASTGYVRSTFNTASGVTQTVNGVDTATDSDKIYSSRNNSYYYYEALDTNEYNSVNTNKGYYIGRYEASGSGNTVKVQYNQTPYVNITKANCVTKSAILGNGYKTAYPTTNATVFTKLCSSYAWDTALRFIDENSINSSYSSNSTQDWYNTTAKQNTGLTTAVCNIYDMGGNVWEYTTESVTNTSSPYVGRGGDYRNSSSEWPAGSRGSADGNAYDTRGFRVALFL